MKYLRLLLVLAGLVFLAALTGWWVAGKAGQDEALVYDVKQSPVDFVFSSSFSDIPLTTDWVDELRLQAGLASLGFDGTQPLIVFGQQETVVPERVEVQFRDINGLAAPRGNVGVVMSNGEPVVAYTARQQGKTVTYAIYLHPSLWRELPMERILPTFSYHTWRLLGHALGNQAIESELAEWDTELKDGLFGEQAEASSFRLQLVPQAYATCTGTYACGLMVQDCTCSQAGYPCDRAGNCGTVGTCSCNPEYCDSNAGCADCGPGPCSGSEGTCGALNPCYGGTVECEGENSCAWVTPPVYTPTQGPSPTNGPSPTGQSCAQSNCGSTCSNNSTCYGGTTCQWQGANGFVCWDGGTCCSSGGFQSNCGDYCNEATGNFCFGSGFTCKAKAEIPSGGCSHNNCCWRDSCTVQPTPTPIAATISGDLFCQHGGVYPNRWAPTSDFYAWVGDANGRLNDTLVSTNYSGDGKGTYTISNWYPPGYPSNWAFYVRAGFALDQTNAGIWGSNGGIGGCASPYEGCNFSTIANTNTSGFNFALTDVNFNTMEAIACGPSQTGPFTLKWRHADRNPSRYKILMNNNSNGNTISTPTDIRCFMAASDLGCYGSDGMCTFTTSSQVGCSYIPGATYDWWAVQPKTDSGSQYFCEQPVSLACPIVTVAPTSTSAPTPTPIPPTPTPTNAPNTYTVRVRLKSGESTISGDTCIDGDPSGLLRDMEWGGPVGEVRIRKQGEPNYIGPYPMNFVESMNLYQAVIHNIPDGTHSIRYTPPEGMGTRCPDIHDTQTVYNLTVAGGDVTSHVYVGFDISGSILDGGASRSCDLGNPLEGGTTTLVNLNNGVTQPAIGSTFEFKNKTGRHAYNLSYVPPATHANMCPTADPPGVGVYEINFLRQPHVRTFTAPPIQQGDLEVKLRYKNSCGVGFSQLFTDPSVAEEVTVSNTSGFSDTGELVSPTWDVTFPNLTAGLYSVALTEPVTSGYFLCGSSTRGISISADQTTTVTYLLSVTGQPFWWVRGGDVHAKGVMDSSLPIGTQVSRKLNNVTDSGGLLSSAGEAITAGQGSYREDKNWKVVNHSYDDVTKAPEDYSYFWQLAGDEATSYGGSTKPPCSADTTCIFKKSGSMIISSTDTSWETEAQWQAGSKIVMFVDGNLNVSHNINLNDNLNGKFLAFIVSGDIVVSPTVTQLRGIYIASGDINFGTSNSTLWGKGTFVGWNKDGTDGVNGIFLGRDNDDLVQASEVFLYWPELILNTPRELTTTRQYFVEGIPRDVVPGNVPTATPTPIGGPTNTPTPKPPTPTPTPTLISCTGAGGSCAAMCLSGSIANTDCSLSGLNCCLGTPPTNTPTPKPPTPTPTPIVCSNVGGTCIPTTDVCLGTLYTNSTCARNRPAQNCCVPVAGGT